MTIFNTTGTISVTNGSATVTGTGSNWATALIGGGTLFVEGAAYPIASVASDTSLTLAVVFAGVTGAGKTYAIAVETTVLEQTTRNANALAELLTGLTPFATFSGFSKTLNTNENAGAWRTGLGLGSMAVQAAGSVAITGGTISGTAISGGTFSGGTITGITDLAVADGGTASSTPAGATTALAAVSYGSAQSITAAQKGQARANIGADLLAGFRNKIINPRFEVTQRGIGPFTSGGYTADRWHLVTWGTGGAGSLSISAPNILALAVNRRGILAWDRTTAGSSVSRLRQKIEGVQTLQGKTVTFAILGYANEAGIVMSVRLDQHFGTGGTPSVDVIGTAASFTLAQGGAAIRMVTLSVPSVAGKTLGTDKNDCLILNIDSPASGAFNIRLLDVAVVEGDATAEADPFAPRHIQQEIALCKRYYERIGSVMLDSANLANLYPQAYWSEEKRATPSLSVISLTGGSGAAFTTSSQSPRAGFLQTGANSVIGQALIAGDSEL